MNLAEVPVVVLDHLSETQRRAYIIADNKLALNAGWDEKALAAELRDLEDDGMDLALVGFSAEELDDLLSDPDAPQTAPDVEDEAPEAPANPVTRLGDLWAIGPHRLICGDCRDRNIVPRLFAEDRANVVITSPPYATQREYDTSSGFTPIPPEEYVAFVFTAQARAGTARLHDVVAIRRALAADFRDAVAIWPSVQRHSRVVSP